MAEILKYPVHSGSSLKKEIYLRVYSRNEWKQGFLKTMAKP